MVDVGIPGHGHIVAEPDPEVVPIPDHVPVQAVWIVDAVIAECEAAAAVAMNVAHTINQDLVIQEVYVVVDEVVAFAIIVISVVVEVVIGIVAAGVTVVAIVIAIIVTIVENVVLIVVLAVDHSAATIVKEVP